VIVLEFDSKDIDIAFEKAKEYNLENVDSVEFSKKLFVMPVHLRVDNVEMLEMSVQYGRVVTEWPFLPIVDMASYGLEMVYDAWIHGQSEIWVSEIGLRLTLERDGDNINIQSHNMNRKCSVPYIELEHAFEDFAKTVKETLLKGAPELAKHSYWGGWFRGEVKTPWRDWKDE